MLNQETNVNNNLTISEDNNSVNDSSNNFSLYSYGFGETSAFKDYQEERSDCSKYDYNSDKKLFYCPCCFNTVEINFISKEEIVINCQKQRKTIKNLFTIKDYLHDNNIKMNNDENIYNLYCRRHAEINIFNKFDRCCKNCKFNLCKDCNFRTRCEKHDFDYLNLKNEEKTFLDEYLL